MSKGITKVAIVGASTLIGKEIAEELASGGSPFGVVDVVLLEGGDEAGKLTSTGDEASFVGKIEADSFEGLDLCFFAGTAEETQKHWSDAVRAGVGVVDLTGALQGIDGVQVRAPWVTEAMSGSELLSLEVRAVVPAHPVAVMLGLVAARCAALGLREMAATVLEPASQHGSLGVDEMHQQTVSLLSFQSVPKVEYDAQVTFNLLPELGAEARVSMKQTASRIARDYATQGSGSLAGMSLQMVQAPVFHGYGLSLLLDFQAAVSEEAIEKALAGAHVEVAGAEDDAPSNVGVAGRQEMLVRVGESHAARSWLWIVADNLKFNALHAIACAAELQRMRPRGAVH